MPGRRGRRARAVWAWGGASLLHNRRSTMSALAVSHVYPLGSRLNERGRLEVGGCDVVELAAEFGTPAYVYAEDDMRARARTFVEAFRARSDRFEVIYASKAFPCTAAYRLFAEEGLSADVASGGELHLALAAGMDPKRLYMHGNNKSPAELDYAIESGIGHIVVDSFDEIERLRGRSQRVMLRVTPGIEPSTHSYIQTGQVDSKFGFPMAEVPAGGGRVRGGRARAARPARAHRLADPRRRGVREARRAAGRDGRLSAAEPGRRARNRLHRGGPPAVDRGVRGRAASSRARRCDRALRARPRARGQRRRHRLHGGDREADPRRAHVRVGGRRHVRQPAPDALRRALRGRDRGPLLGGAS